MWRGPPPPHHRFAYKDAVAAMLVSHHLAVIVFPSWRGVLLVNKSFPRF